MVAQLRNQDTKDPSQSRKVYAFIRKWDLSYKEAAEVFQVNHVTVRRWFCGDRSPDMGYERCSEVLDELWTIKGKPVIKTY